MKVKVAIILILTMLLSLPISAGKLKTLNEMDWNIYYRNSQAGHWEQLNAEEGNKDIFVPKRPNKYVRWNISYPINRDKLAGVGYSDDNRGFFTVVNAEGEIIAEKEVFPPWHQYDIKLSPSGEKAIISSNDGCGIWHFKQNHYEEISDSLRPCRFDWNDSSTQVIMSEECAYPGIYLYDLLKKRMITIKLGSEDDKTYIPRRSLYFLDDHTIMFRDYGGRVWKYDIDLNEKEILFEDTITCDRKGFVTYGDIVYIDQITPDRKYILASRWKVYFFQPFVEHFCKVLIGIYTKEVISLPDSKKKYSYIILPKERLRNGK